MKKLALTALAFFAFTGLANALYQALENSASRFLIVLSPLDLLQAISEWLFGGGDDTGGLAGADVSGLVYIAGVLGMAALSAFIMYRRYLADE